MKLSLDNILKVLNQMAEMNQTGINPEINEIN